MNIATAPQPARLTIDYPDRPLDRLSTLLRLFYAIPVAVLLGLIGATMSGDSAAHIGAFGGVLVLPVLLTILFRQKYPRWWFDFHLELARFSTRVVSYTRRGRRRLVRRALHRPLPPRHLRFCRGRPAMGPPRPGLRLPARHRPLPALHAGLSGRPDTKEHHLKAIVQHTYGSTDVLVVADIPTPDIADDEVLVRVHAAGVDRPGARCPRAARSGLQQRRHRAGVVSATQDGSQLRVVSPCET